MYQHINLSDEQISEKQLLKEHKSSNEINRIVTVQCKTLGLNHYG